MFAVVVTFTLAPGQMEHFLPLMLENARTSLRDEPDCHQFDVATDKDRPGEVFLYELYSDAEAFAQHLASSHFKRFDAATRAMIAAKSVVTYRQVEQ
jgi:quinol monooxygenase YgiN